MLGQLIPIGGGMPIQLLRKKLLVGRRSSCDIKLDFPNVSSHHCELELKNGYWHIRDLGSSNGIKVNGERCDSKVLTPGDEVAISKQLFRIDYTVKNDAPAPEEESTFSRSLMEKAGLEVDRPRRSATQGAKDEAAARPKVKRRTSSEDEFLMEWFPEE